MRVIEYFLLVGSKKHKINGCYMKYNRVIIMILSYYDFDHYDFVGTPLILLPKE